MWNKSTIAAAGAAALFFTSVAAQTQQTDATSAPEADSGGVIEGDATAGAAVFIKCRACHSIEPNKMKVGPSLYGVVGRTPGTLEGYKFSPAMIAFGVSGAVWDEATLDAYLIAPRDMVPGIKMIFPGLPDSQNRADLFAYFESLVAEDGAQ